MSKTIKINVSGRDVTVDAAEFQRAVTNGACIPDKAAWVEAKLVDPVTFRVTPRGADLLASVASLPDDPVPEPVLSVEIGQRVRAGGGAATFEIGVFDTRGDVLLAADPCYADEPDYCARVSIAPEDPHERQCWSCWREAREALLAERRARRRSR